VGVGYIYAHIKCVLEYGSPLPAQVMLGQEKSSRNCLAKGYCETMMRPMPISLETGKCNL